VVLLAGCGGANVEPSLAEYFPAHGAARADGLVSARWLKAALDRRSQPDRCAAPPTLNDRRLVVVEASWGSLAKAEEYRSGHIPGAVHLDTDDLEDGYPRWRLRNPADLHRAIGRLGVSPDSAVVVYGDKLIAAARAWWVLKYAGVADVRLLDGGLRAWRAAGYPVETAVVVPAEVEFVASVQTQWLAETPYLRARLAGDEIWLADTRSRAEFEGRKSGYSYLDAVGRIPKSIHVEDADDGDEHYRKPDGKLRPPAEILAMWKSRGIAAAHPTRFDREVVFYCGSGWRSSVAFFYAWLLGFENMRNYSDGWCAWSTDYRPDPTAKGSTPGWRQQPTGNPIVIGR
jgi:thiosulfate/3-mercaptopyruvate sulfurtransferase